MNVVYLLDRYWWSRVEIAGPDECWCWLLSTGSHGYGQTWDGETVLLAHRVAWTLTLGEIPEGMTIDHLCRNRVCCNPAHMRLMTNQANAALNGNSVKTHCKHGHEFTTENTETDERGHRRCRACAKAKNDQRAIDRGAPWPPPTECVCGWCGETFRRPSMRGMVPKFCKASHRTAFHQRRKVAA